MRPKEKGMLMLHRALGGVLGMVLHSCNLSSQEVKTESFQVRGRPGLHSKTLSQKTKKDKTES
jgi:hypothetical protein